MLSGKKSKVILRIFGIILLAGVTQLSFGQGQEKGKPWIAPESATKVKSPVAASVENITEGKALYEKHCKSCHGAKGKGDGTKAANLEISSGDFTSADFKKQTDGGIYWKMTEGRDPMPTFKKKVSDEERWQIVAYLRTLGENKK